MGLELKILPEHSENSNFSNTVIDTHSNYELYDIISKVIDDYGVEVPKEGVDTHMATDLNTGEYIFGTTKIDPYGNELKSVLVEELNEGLRNYITDNWKNKAFMAYLKELPSKLKIWFYWH